MRPVLTPEEMRAADERTIAAGTAESVLMERAGLGVAWAVRRWAGGCYGLRVVACCGKGNNGGDGLVAADALESWGARVSRVRLGAGVDRARVGRDLGRGAVVVDAMFGTGFSGALEGDAAWLSDAIADVGAGVVSVDIPSGVDGLTGAVEGPAVRADTTVVMAALKTGLVQEPGRSHAGEIEVVDIGIDLGSAPVARLGVTEAADVASWLPVREPDTHKWSVGGVMVVGGSDGMIGAPMMVSRAALRAGAGIIWCCVPGGTSGRTPPNEVISRALPSHEGVLAAESAGEVLESIERFRALVLGPGLGTGASVSEAVRALVAGAEVPLVLDADGLNALSGGLETLRGRSSPTVLTPHAGEYERLAGTKVGRDRVAAARALAAGTEAVVVLKGSASIVATPDGRVAVNPTGSAALATAGTGDVLAGVIGAFLAQGMPAFEAASAGAYVHGACADGLPAGGLVASDLIEALPRTLERVQDAGDVMLSGRDGELG